MGFIELFLSNQISSDLYGLRGPLQYVNLIRGAAQHRSLLSKRRSEPSLSVKPLKLHLAHTSSLSPLSLGGGLLLVKHEK